MKIENRIIMWALTYRCNMSCEYCYLKDSRKLKKNEISEIECLEIANKIINSSDWVPDAVWLTGGEATLNSKLAELISLFESNKIKTVINTNGFISQIIAQQIIDAKPRGINISLDFPDISNDDARGNTNEVIKIIKYIASKKDDYTILGISIVLNKKNVSQLHNISIQLKNMGVEYISLNPLFSEGNLKEENIAAEEFYDQILKIKSDGGITLPNEKFLKMLYAYYKGDKQEYTVCPAAANYFFISPWGQLFPCSNEFWHNRSLKKSVFITDNNDLAVNVKELEDSIDRVKYSTHSLCFNARCMGCWKLYLDDVFI